MHAAECWSLKRACRLEEVFSMGRRASNGILQRVNALGETPNVLVTSADPRPEFLRCPRSPRQNIMTAFAGALHDFEHRRFSPMV